MRSREALEAEGEQRLAANGWEDRSAVVALEPELESWVWSDSREVDQVMNWTDREPALRTWIQKQGFAVGSNGKPLRPEEAYQSALRHVRKQPSSALFRSLAARVSASRCTDAALAKLLATLRAWFPS
jgi:hypothetical protein